jgi:peroxiredoxin
MLRLNAPAPPLNLRNQFGIATGLEQLRGHIVVMWWHRTIGEAGAENIARSLRDRYPDFTMRNATVVGISGDPPVANRRFQELLNLPFDLLSDGDGRTSDAYGVGDWWRANPDTPLTLVLDAKGLIRANRQIDRTEMLADILLDDVSRATSW